MAFLSTSPTDSPWASPRLIPVFTMSRTANWMGSFGSSFSMSATMPSRRSAFFSRVSWDGASAKSHGFDAMWPSLTACRNIRCSVTWMLFT